MASSSAYRRLPGRGRSFGGNHSVWLASDHLLFAERRSTLEEYRRIRLGEIQAIAVAATSRYRRRGLLWLGLLLLFGLPIAFGGSGARIASLILVSPIVVGAILHFAAGPTCSVEIRTRVQTFGARAWGRRRAFRRALAEILPRIQEAQGQLDERSALLEPDAVAPIVAPVGTEPERKALRAFKPRAHQLLAGVLVAGGLASIWAAIADTTLSDWIGSGVFLLVFVAVVTALIRQANTTASAAIKRWTWSVLAAAVVKFVAASVSTTMRSFDSTLSGEGMSPADFIGRLPNSLEGVFAALLFLLAVMGAAALRSPHRPGEQ